MDITFNSPITAAEGRRLTGKIVPFGEAGNTNQGPVIFSADAFTGLDPANVKLLLEHDQTAPIGRAETFHTGPDGITGSFRISRTTRGTDALTEAADGLRDGLSVGVKATAWDTADDGTMTVTAAHLVEVSLVTNPAFNSARITDVAASKPKKDKTVSETTTEATPEVAPEPAPAPEPTVPADIDPRIYAPVAYAAPRINTNITAGQFLRTNIEAALGNADAKEIVAALATNQTSGAAGIIPVPYMRDIIGIVDSSRPFIDSIQRAALPDSGMTFRIPTWSTQPTVGQTSELAQPSSTATSITNTTVSVVKFAGAENISVELLDRSDPAYFDELIRVLTAKYAQQTDAYALGIATTAATATTQTGLTGTVAILAKAQTDALGVYRSPANRLLVASDKWGVIIAEKDSTGRPLYNSINPNNAPGESRANAMVGDVMGMQMAVDPNATAGTAIIYRNDGIGYYESPSPVQVRVTQVSSLSVDVAVYGYCAAVAKISGGVRSVTL